MKTILLAFLLSPFFVYSQSDTTIKYIHTKEIEGLNKDQLFSKVKMWAANSFQRVSAASQLEDKEGGMLAYNATLVQKYSPKSDEKPKFRNISNQYSYTFKITAQVKDNKYRLTVSDIKYYWMGDQITLTSSAKAPFKYTLGSQQASNQEWLQVKSTFEDFTNKLLAKLDETVAKKDDF